MNNIFSVSVSVMISIRPSSSRSKRKKPASQSSSPSIAASQSAPATSSSVVSLYDEEKTNRRRVRERESARRCRLYVCACVRFRNSFCRHSSKPHKLSLSSSEMMSCHESPIRLSESLSLSHDQNMMLGANKPASKNWNRCALRFKPRIKGT